MTEGPQIEDLKRLIVHHQDELATCDAATHGRQMVDKQGNAIAVAMAGINKEAGSLVKAGLDYFSVEWVKLRRDFLRFYEPGDFEDSIEETLRANANRAKLNEWYRGEVGEFINLVSIEYNILE